MPRIARRIGRHRAAPLLQPCQIMNRQMLNHFAIAPAPALPPRCRSAARKLALALGLSPEGEGALARLLQEQEGALARHCEDARLARQIAARVRRDGDA
jgi:hypothetical protein